MKTAIIYFSRSGNTKMVADSIYERISREERVEVEMHSVREFDPKDIHKYDGFIIGTYTWGDGEIPVQFDPLMKEIASSDIRGKLTGVFGTGDDTYPNFCGAVDTISGVLNSKSRLMGKLKMLLNPKSEQDFERCRRFADRYVEVALERMLVKG
jgi:flavodoxin I